MTWKSNVERKKIVKKAFCLFDLWLSVTNNILGQTGFTLNIHYQRYCLDERFLRDDYSGQDSIKSQIKKNGYFHFNIFGKQDNWMGLTTSSPSFPSFVKRDAKNKGREKNGWFVPTLFLGVMLDRLSQRGAACSLEWGLRRWSLDRAKWSTQPELFPVIVTSIN